MKAISIALMTISIVSASAYAEDNQAMQTINKSAQVQPSVDNNQMTGEKFLMANKLKPGVVTLADGLQYKIITAGTGPKPTENDSVTVNYAGTLIDGTEFDSSYKRNQPATFQVNQVIPGWTEALKLMNVGSTWELYIPAKLAYGDRGVPPVIGPNQTLIFKVDLLAINK